MTTVYKIRTNNAARELIAFDQLTAKEQKDFDYVEGEDRFSPRFARYKGVAYDIHEFRRLEEAQMAKHDAPDVFKGWEGYQGDSYFSGVVMRWAKDDAGAPGLERVILGTYCC